MRILITGGCGFIGSHLAEYLLAAGHEVTAMDDLSTGSLDNIAAIKTHPKFTLVVDSVLNDAAVGELVERADRVFHLAAAVGVRRIVERPVETIETNVRGTEHVLRHAVRTGCRVMIASTSEVYGKSTTIPFQEDADLVSGPTTIQRWAYACSKALDEFLALAYYKEKQLPVFVVRFFNTVGPRQTGQYGMVVPSFVRRALAGETLLVHGDGTQSRCFTHVRDVVRAVAALADRDDAMGRVFNIGGTEEISMQALADRIVALCDSASEVKLQPYAEAFDSGFEDMKRRVPDVSRLEATLGFKPNTPLDDILRDVIAAHRGAAVNAQS
jgi:UDP-glucose 4-epimerase